MTTLLQLGVYSSESLSIRNKGEFRLYKELHSTLITGENKLIVTENVVT